MHYVIVILCIIFSAIYCLVLVYSNAYDNCHEELELKWFISDALLSFVIPFAIITILNCLIINDFKKSIQNNQHYRFANASPQSTEMIALNLKKKSWSTNDMQLHTSTLLKTDANIAIQKSKVLILLNSFISPSCLLFLGK